jgi:hypothetical protein
MTRSHADTDKLTDSQRLARRLLGPEGPELSCEACFEQLDRYVELELAGAGADERVPGMRAHLDGCAACNEEHASLRDLVAAERRGQAM